MPRPFELVEDKLFEADFFLERLATTKSMFEARYYFSAFATAARSVTFVLQACMSDVTGFAEWYEVKRGILREDSTSRFFLRIRNESQKIGTNPFRGGSFGPGGAKHFIIDEDAPESDAVLAAKRYMLLVTETVHECFAGFGAVIDPDEYYTLENLARIGWSLEDVEEELGFPRGWTAIDGADPHDRLSALRRNVPMSTIDVLFEKYLGRSRPAVERRSAV